MKPDFVFEPRPDGLLVRTTGSRSVPVSEWTANVARPLGAGALIRIRDNGGAVEADEDCSLVISWKCVAGLTTDELRYVGLPDAAPFALEVVADGTIRDTDFRIHYGFIENGRRVVGVEREGAWLHVGDDSYVLLDPLNAIADAIDQFNHVEIGDLESRMLGWGRIAEILPPSALIDDRLRALRVVVASAFELDPFVNENGEPDFDPVVGQCHTRAGRADEEESAFIRSLPEARQREFARRFRGFSQVKHRYTVGGNVYVVLAPELECALGAVRHAQSGTAEDRRAFLQNVSGCLRGELNAAGEDAIPVDSVFNDDGLSDRVRGVGIWIEKALPWVRMAAEPWLPPEDLGLRIGSQLVSMAPKDLPVLLEKVNIAIRNGDPRVETDDGVEIPATPTTINSIEELIRWTHPVQAPLPDPNQHEPLVGPPRPKRADQVLIIVDNLGAVQFVRKQEKRAPAISNECPALRTQLLPHQQECLAWLQRHWLAGSSGALLADDMGLGKTLEALVFLAWLNLQAEAGSADRRPLLVVAPTGLLRNWLDEHDRHLLNLGLGRAVHAHGTELRKLRTANGVQGNELTSNPPVPKLDIVALTQADWVLTTYETMRDYQHSFARVRWRAAVFDEAQKIKNPSARITDAALALNVDFALLMTGTPVENRPADLWSMLDRAEPGAFGTLKDFSQLYEAHDKDQDSALVDLHRKVTEESTAPAIMLRRLKENHLSRLPDKRVHRYEVAMSRTQAARYEQAVLHSHQDVSMLETLHRLRSISLHPCSPEGLDAGEYIAESARLAKTFSILEEVRDQREKVLVFVESKQMQVFLIGVLKQRFHLPDDPLVINGMVSGQERKARVDTFQERSGFDIMILSPRAGGVGLTITAANHVIHLSRWWNPAVEDQCTDRVFRIGQERTVNVYLPLAVHPRFGDYSFDLKLDSLLERKRTMNRTVLAPTAAKDGDIRSLFHSTTTEACNTAQLSRPREDGINIDLLEPTRFEDWVLSQFGKAGYVTHRTPRSGDRGADGLAVWQDETQPHTIIVQCKHTQPHAKCGPAAIFEVLRSISQYEISGSSRPTVVTNAAGFTSTAELLARRMGVRLVDRHGLSKLQNWPSGLDETEA